MRPLASSRRNAWSIPPPTPTRSSGIYSTATSQSGRLSGRGSTRGRWRPLSSRAPGGGAVPTHITARLAWHNDGWDGSVCKTPERNTYCVGCKSFPGDVIARGRDLQREKQLAGKSGSQLEGYVPPCSYSYNAFGPERAAAASNPPEFFFGKAKRHEWELDAATVSVWPYEAMYAEEVRADGFLDNSRRRQLALEFFNPILDSCGKNLIFYYANYSNPLSEEEAPKYVLIGVSRITRVGPGSSSMSRSSPASLSVTPAA